MPLEIPRSRQLALPYVALLQAAARSADAVGVRMTVVGATARDIICHGVHGLPVQRMTADVDIAIAVPSWEAFRDLCTHLLSDHRFSRAPQTPNRLRFNHGTGPSLPLDLIPYGSGVDSPIFAWPNDRDSEMNIAGYEEAAAHADVVAIEDGLTLNTASLPGLTLMKLYAWEDRHKVNNPKDASDLAFILRNYLAAGNRERIYADALPVLEAVEFDEDRLGPRLLGVDLSRILTPQSRTDLEVLIRDRWVLLAKHISASWRYDEDALDRAHNLLADFSQGILRPP